MVQISQGESNFARQGRMWIPLRKRRRFFAHACSVVIGNRSWWSHPTTTLEGRESYFEERFETTQVFICRWKV